MPINHDAFEIAVDDITLCNISVALHECGDFRLARSMPGLSVGNNFQAGRFKDDQTMDSEKKWLQLQ